MRVEGNGNQRTGKTRNENVKTLFSVVSILGNVCCGHRKQHGTVMWQPLQFQYTIQVVIILDVFDGRLPGACR